MWLSSIFTWMIKVSTPDPLVPTFQCLVSDSENRSYPLQVVSRANEIVSSSRYVSHPRHSSPSNSTAAGLKPSDHSSSTCSIIPKEVTAPRLRAFRHGITLAVVVHPPSGPTNWKWGIVWPSMLANSTNIDLGVPTGPSPHTLVGRQPVLHPHRQEATNHRWSPQWLERVPNDCSDSWHENCRV